MNSINRLPARATSYSYESEQDALALDRDASRMKLLNGMWKFHFAAEETDAPADFFKVGFDCSAWNDIPVPSCWEIQDFGVRTILDAEYKDARLQVRPSVKAPKGVNTDRMKITAVLHDAAGNPVGEKMAVLVKDVLGEQYPPLSFRAKHPHLSFRAEPEGRSREICHFKACQTDLSTCYAEKIQKMSDTQPKSTYLMRFWLSIACFSQK